MIRERLLRVEAPHFVAGALFARSGIGWECTDAAPILCWMVGKSPTAIGHYLKRKGWRHEWL
jgi:hypothetical protein